VTDRQTDRQTVTDSVCVCVGVCGWVVARHFWRGWICENVFYVHMPTHQKEESDFLSNTHTPTPHVGAPERIKIANDMDAPETQGTELQSETGSRSPVAEASTASASLTLPIAGVCTWCSCLSRSPSACSMSVWLSHSQLFRSSLAGVAVTPNPHFPRHTQPV
jgi:hypothetical protein